MLRKTNTRTKTERNRGLFRSIALGTSISIGLGAFHKFCDYSYERLPENHTGKTIVEGLKNYTTRNKDPRANQGEANQYGHRTRDEYPIEKPEDEYRILGLGGSVLYGSGVVMGQTAPDYSQRRLQKLFPNKHIRFMNAAWIGMDSFEIWPYYRDHQQKYGTNLVVIHTGKNDATTRLRGGEPDSPPSLRVKVKLKPKFGQEKLLNNSFIGASARYISAIFYDRTSEAARIKKEIEEKMKDEKKMAEMIKKSKTYPQIFHDNIENIVKLAKANGSDVILFPEPVKINRGDGFSREWYEMEEATVRRNAEVLREIAQKYGVSYIEINEKTIPDENFLDFCHRNEKGEEIIGNYLAARIKPFVERWAKERKSEQERLAQARQQTLENSLSPNYETPDKNLTLQQIHDEYQSQKAQQAQEYPATATSQDEIQTDSTITLQQESKLEAVVK